MKAVWPFTAALLAVFIDDLQEWHQATFFYESAANLILFIIMLIVARRVKKDGWMTAFAPINLAA